MSRVKRFFCNGLRVTSKYKSLFYAALSTTAVMSLTSLVSIQEFDNNNKEHFRVGKQHRYAPFIMDDEKVYSVEKKTAYYAGYQLCHALDDFDVGNGEVSNSIERVEWDIELTLAGPVLIGIATANHRDILQLGPTKYFACDHMGMYVVQIREYGGIWKGGSKHCDPLYGYEAPKSGDIITVVLNIKECTLSYKLNGQSWLDNVFTDLLINEEPYHLFVGMYHGHNLWGFNRRIVQTTDKNDQQQTTV